MGRGGIADDGDGYSVSPVNENAAVGGVHHQVHLPTLH